jgi:hypothetical protein
MTGQKQHILGNTLHLDTQQDATYYTYHIWFKQFHVTNNKIVTFLHFWNIKPKPSGEHTVDEHNLYTAICIYIWVERQYKWSYQPPQLSISRISTSRSYFMEALCNILPFSQILASCTDIIPPQILLEVKSV